MVDHWWQATFGEQIEECLLCNHYLGMHREIPPLYPADLSTIECDAKVPDPSEVSSEGWNIPKLKQCACELKYGPSYNVAKSFLTVGAEPVGNNRW